MFGTVAEFGGCYGADAVWVQLDGDCRVWLTRRDWQGHPAPILGQRVKVAVGDIHCHLIEVLS